MPMNPLKIVCASITKAQLDKLCQDCEAILRDGKTDSVLRAIALWRRRTGQGLKDAKRNIEVIESGEGEIDVITVICPTLLREYQDCIHERLTSLGSVSAEIAMDYLPTLSIFIRPKLERQYAKCNDAVKGSVFRETTTVLGGGAGAFQVGTARTNISEPRVASDYAEIMKKLSLHAKMLEMMKTEDFPGK